MLSKNATNKRKTKTSKTSLMRVASFKIYKIENQYCCEQNVSQEKEYHSR